MKTLNLVSIPLVFSFLGLCALNPERLLGQSLPGGRSGEDEVAAHFRAGKEALRAGQTERAIHEYKEALHLMPNLAEAHANLGMAYYDAGQYQQAATELEEARREKPGRVGVNLYLGIAYRKLGLQAKAIPPLEDVLRQDSGNQEALQALAASYLAQDNYRDATQVYLELSAAKADIVESCSALGQNYLTMAKQLSIEISRRFQGTSWAERFAGDELADRERWVDAAARYRQALALDAAQPGLHAALGDMLLRQGRLENAEAQYRAELQRDANSEEALLGLAAVDLGRGSANLALEKVTRIWDVLPPFLGRQTDFPLLRIEAPKLGILAQDLAAAPDSPAREFLLASVYRAAGQSEQAAEQWSMLLPRLQTWNITQEKVESRAEQGDGPCETHRYAECAELIRARKIAGPGQKILVGRALLALGNDQAAAIAFAEASNYDKSSAQSRYLLMRTYERLALARFDQIEKLAPDSWRLHQMLGEYYEFQLNYKKAIVEFQTALKSHPDSAELHEQLGDAYLFDKNVAAGEAEIEEALRLDPIRPNSLYLRGRVYFGKREISKSIEYFQAALRFDPNFLQARADLGRAYMRSGKAASAVPELEKAAPTDDNGDLHYLLSVAYRHLGKADSAAEALAVSEELRRSYAARGRAAMAAAEEELANR